LCERIPLLCLKATSPPPAPHQRAFLKAEGTPSRVRDIQSLALRHNHINTPPLHPSPVRCAKGQRGGRALLGPAAIVRRVRRHGAWTRGWPGCCARAVSVVPGNPPLRRASNLRAGDGGPLGPGMVGDCRGDGVGKGYHRK